MEHWEDEEEGTGVGRGGGKTLAELLGVYPCWVRSVGFLGQMLMGAVCCSVLSHKPEFDNYLCPNKPQTALMSQSFKDIEFTN